MILTKNYSVIFTSYYRDFCINSGNMRESDTQYSGVISETRATLKKVSKMAAVQNQNSALPNLKNLTRENFGKLSNQQHKVSFVPLGYKRSISALQNWKRPLRWMVHKLQKGFSVMYNFFSGCCPFF